MRGSTLKAKSPRMRANALFFLVVVACFVTPTVARKTAGLLLKRTIPLPSVRGGFNHMSVDAEHQRLFVPAPASGVLEVVDLRSGRLQRGLPAERPTSALYVPEVNRLYLTSGRTLYIYDGDSLHRIATIDLHTRLDQLRYDPSRNEVYVGCMTEGKTGIAVISIPEGKLVRELALLDSPQGFAVEQGGPRIFVNVPEANQVAVIDRRQGKVIQKWTLDGAGDNFPMAPDQKNQRLFIACGTPAEMLAIDTQSGRIVARVPCVGDADDMWYDGARRRIYISGGGGFVSVIEQQSPDHYHLLQRVATAPGAANSAFSSRLKSLFVGVPARGGAAAEIRVYAAAQ